MEIDLKSLNCFLLAAQCTMTGEIKRDHVATPMTEVNCNLQFHIFKAMFVQSEKNNFVHPWIYIPSALLPMFVSAPRTKSCPGLSEPPLPRPRGNGRSQLTLPLSRQSFAGDCKCWWWRWVGYRDNIPPVPAGGRDNPAGSSTTPGNTDTVSFNFLP